jgi:hypothetical protein
LTVVLFDSRQFRRADWDSAGLAVCGVAQIFVLKIDPPERTMVVARTLGKMRTAEAESEALEIHNLVDQLDWNR